MKHLLAIALAVSLGSHAFAMGKDTADAEAQVRAMGKRWDADVGRMTTPLYVPLLAKVSRQDIRATRDIAYGTDNTQKLDVYVTAKHGSRRPVVVYVHGGGLVRGDKDSPDANGLINSNVPIYFAHHGMVGVSINYRLIPNIKYPDGGADVAAAVKWVRANIAQYGGDPDAIFVIGHSAGGTVLGTYLYEPKVNDNAPAIAGAIFLSGVVELDEDGPREGDTRHYYGDDKSRWGSLDAYSKIDLYAGKRVPTFIINAEYDPYEIQTRGGVKHFAKLCEHDKSCPRYFQAQGMNHISTAMSLGTDDDSLGAEMRDFIARTLAAPPKKLSMAPR